MFTPDQIDALREDAGKITDPITEYLIQEIARRIAEAGELTSTAAYQVWRAQQLGMSQRDIQQKLQELLRTSKDEIQRIMYESAQSGYSLDVRRFPTVEAIPFEQNASLQQIVSAAVELAQDNFTNLTQTLGMVDPFGNALPLQDAYRSCTDYAFKQVITGAASYTEAIRQATRNLADKGVRVIDYESGIHTGLEAAVRRNILGGLGLMQEQISQTVYDQLGCDGWEITAHANSAPDHEPIQGRQYPDAEYQALNNSLRRRIGTLNCGHAAFPIILGVNSPQYTPAELEKFRTDNEEGVTVDGVHYTGYQATQMQRKLERAIRRQKNRIMVDEATGDKEKLAKDKTKLTVLHQRYREFSKAAGLRTQYERTEVAGFGEKRSKGLVNSPNRAILKDGNNKGIPITDDAIRRVPQVRPEGWSQEQAERLQEAHRELLRAVKDKPVGTEAGAVYTPDMRLIEQHIGADAGQTISLPHLKEPHILIHSHPSGLTFSKRDIENFIGNFDMASFTVVGNNGAVYLLQKTESYNAVDFVKAFGRTLIQLQQAQTSQEYVNIINLFLEEAKQHGIQFITGG
ncbi:MAG: hypothetical protein HDT14_05395 [Oscillibacter sp.]|nr:hypothetical protein [Oscillibacter sp.]